MLTSISVRWRCYYEHEGGSEVHVSTLEIYLYYNREPHFFTIAPHTVPASMRLSRVFLGEQTHAG